MWATSVQDEDIGDIMHGWKRAKRLDKYVCVELEAHDCPDPKHRESGVLCLTFASAEDGHRFERWLVHKEGQPANRIAYAKVPTWNAGMEWIGNNGVEHSEPECWCDPETVHVTESGTEIKAHHDGGTLTPVAAAEMIAEVRFFEYEREGFRGQQPTGNN